MSKYLASTELLLVCVALSAVAIAESLIFVSFLCSPSAVSEGEGIRKGEEGRKRKKGGE